MTPDKINYVEFSSTKLEDSKTFFQTAFAWEFTDYGPDYTAFSNSGIEGGFFRTSEPPATSPAATLIVLYSDNLEACLAKVEQAGAKISKPIFAFPGGRRFHFVEPGGNELAVWSE